MPDSTVRYRAATRHVYAVALLALTEHARGSADEFEYGPLDLAALEHQGLAVTGSDLAGVRAVLEKVPGLIRDDKSTG